MKTNNFRVDLTDIFVYEKTTVGQPKNERLFTATRGRHIGSDLCQATISGV